MSGKAKTAGAIAGIISAITGGAAAPTDVGRQSDEYDKGRDREQKAQVEREFNQREDAPSGQER